MAEVVSTALYGPQTGSAKAESVSTPATEAQNKSSASGVVWLAVAVIAGVVIFALAQTGGGKGMGEKIGRNMREMTGGLFGKKPGEEH